MTNRNNTTKEEEKKPIKSVSIVTHSGKFHSDDLFAVSILNLWLAQKWGEVEIQFTRTRDEEMIKQADFVVDVGGVYDPKMRRFDHHQEGGAGERANGIPFASAGLVWKEYGADLTGSQEVADRLDRNIFQTIDAMDNGLNIFTEEKYKDEPKYYFENFTNSFRPVSGGDKENNEAFISALPQFVGVLEREIRHTRELMVGEDIVRKKIAGGDNWLDGTEQRVLILDQVLPWEAVMDEYPEVLFVIMPDGTGTWKVRAVRVKPGSFENRLNFPQAWAGQRDTDMAVASGVEDAVFCHNGRFLAVAKSQKGAEELALKALQEAGISK